MKKNRTISILILILVVGAALFAAYGLVLSNNNQQVVDQSETYATSAARLGDLTILTSGAGEVIPAAEFGLSFDQSGMIVEIPVQVGDQVEAGDVLAVLKSDKTRAELEAEIAAAELAVVEAQAALDSLNENAELAAAQALVNLEIIQIALEDLQDLELEKALALQSAAYAQEGIENAEMLLYIYSSSPSEDEVYTAYASWLFKQKALDDLTDQVDTTIYKMVGAPTNIQDRLGDQLLQLNLQLANQRIEVEDAIYRMKTIDEVSDPMDVALAESYLATAQAELAAAQKDLESISTGPNPGELAIVEAALAEAQSEWERIKDGPDPDEVALLKTQLEKAELELVILMEETTSIELVAPIDATVTALSISVGDRVGVSSETSNDATGNSGASSEMDFFQQMLFGSTTTSDSSGSLISLANISNPLVEIYIDESDLTKVEAGYSVEITFGALPDEVFSGEIIEVGSSLETVSGVNAIRTVVLLDASSYVKPSALPIGLSAQADVIAGQSNDAVLVPVEALLEISPDKYIVYVVENDLPIKRNVEVGLVDFTTAEITQGLSAGDVVAINYEKNSGN